MTHSFWLFSYAASIFLQYSNQAKKNSIIMTHNVFVVYFYAHILQFDGLRKGKANRNNVLLVFQGSQLYRIGIFCMNILLNIQSRNFLQNYEC